MALTWVTVLGGFLVLFGLPAIVVLLNARKRGLGWAVLAAIVALLIVGNILESAGIW
jgi:Na+/melibiose symporter-like transporter